MPKRARTSRKGNEGNEVKEIQKEDYTILSDAITEITKAEDEETKETEIAEENEIAEANEKATQPIRKYKWKPSLIDPR